MFVSKNVTLFYNLRIGNYTYIFVFKIKTTIMSEEEKRKFKEKYDKEQEKFESEIKKELKKPGLMKQVEKAKLADYKDLTNSDIEEMIDKKKAEKISEKNLNNKKMSKEKESKKFPSVVTTSSLFGMDERTKLEFDFNTGKYISVTESEDIGPGESYFYSGSAIALDPYLVRRSIGIDFKYGEEIAVDKKEFAVDISKPEVEVWDVADLVTICGQCGTVTPVFTVEKATQFTMTTRSDSTIILTCPNCGNEMSLAMQNGRVLDVERATPENLDNAMRGEAIELSEKLKIEIDEPQEKSNK